jgi:hypothetical protein
MRLACRLLFFLKKCELTVNRMAIFIRCICALVLQTEEFQLSTTEYCIVQYDMD